MKYDNENFGIGCLALSKQMIAIGGGDGLRLINVISWNPIILWDGKGDAVKVFDKENYKGV